MQRNKGGVMRLEELEVYEEEDILEEEEEE